MALSAQTRPEPMNSSPHHSKVKVSMTLASPIFVAGTHITGKMEMECRADKGLGISVMMVELFASQELTSRDHSATSTFIHSRRLFQGPGLPPSNAVQAHPLPGDPPLPPNYHQARRGISTFLFRIPIPASAPSSISFGADLARVRYEVRASAGVFWKGEKRLVINTRELDVVESFDVDFSRLEPEGVVVGEYGKIWVQGSVVGGVVVAGESACVELQVKNHSNKKNTGLNLTLSRTLVLPGVKSGEKSALQISDVLATVPFRGADYIIPPGAEGVASLVFDVPQHARGVRGGTLEGDEAEGRTSESLFEVRCVLGITINMGMGSKDIHLDLPVSIVHPAALPDEPEAYSYPGPSATPAPYLLQTPYAYPALPMSPPIPAAYIDEVHNQVWLPPPTSHTPVPYHQSYYFPPQPHVPIPTYLPVRPLSAGRDLLASNAVVPEPHLLPEPEEGKGARALRVTQHLRLSSRHRSVSPRSHRFPLPTPPVAAPVAAPPPQEVRLRNLPPPPLAIPINTSTPSANGAMVHSPRPFLSPKHSYTNSIPKSERVEQLERMADEVAKTATDLSADLPKPDASPSPVLPKLLALPEPLSQDDLDGSNINKTLPAPPLPTLKESAKEDVRKEGKQANGRTRIDTYFSTSTPGGVSAVAEPKAPPTPLAAVTPIRHPFRPRSIELRASLHPGVPESSGRSESGLDALERRLLAEVGTRKIEAERRPDVRSVVAQPIDIPCKDTSPEPLNDSAISSLALACEELQDREQEDERELELEVDHDSDEKTHRAGLSSVSGGSGRDLEKVKGRKSDGEKEKKVVKRKDKERARGRDGELNGRTKKKSAASNGRVAAWLGGIDPEIPPMEEAVLTSPTVPRNPAPFLDNANQAGTPAALGLIDKEPRKDAPNGQNTKEVSSVPNPRSSGFVPIGTLKHDTLQRRFHPHAKEMTVAEEARRVADLWSSPATPAAIKIKPSPIVKDTSPLFPVISPAIHTAQSIKTNRRVSPPSSAAALDVLGAKHYKYHPDKPSPKPTVPSKPTSTTPAKKLVSQPSLRLPAFPPPPAQPDPEVKYDIRSARGGRGGRVAAVASIWASGDPAAAEPKPKDTQKKPTADRPVTAPKPSPRAPTATTDLRSRDLSRKPTAAPPPKPLRTPAKSLLTASAPVTNADTKLVELAGKRSRPIIKSSSVPAVISSSHATPTLSSTASLARPSPTKVRSPPTKVSVSIAEERTDVVARAKAQMKPETSVKPNTTGGDLAFGQARLRDLIKKYQGQSA